MVFRESLQEFGTQHIAFDVFLFGIINGQTAVEVEMLVIAAEKLAQRHRLVHRGHHRSGGHNFVSVDFAQLQETAHRLALLGFEHAFFHAHIHHSLHLFTAHRGLHLAAIDEQGDEFGEQHQGIGDDNEHSDDTRGPQCKTAPISGADDLRNDFGHDQNQQRHHSRSYAHRVAFTAWRTSIGVPQFCRLRSHASRTHSVGNGVERKDGGNGTIDVGLIAFEHRGYFVAFLLFDGGKRSGGCQKHGF